MFTGLIEGIGRVTRAGAVLAVETVLAAGLAPGESLAVDGSCLTVEEAKGNEARFRVSPETLGRTVPLKAGSMVNLERPVKMDGRLHGHLVTGHVDCTGLVAAVRKAAGFAVFRFTCPGQWHGLLVEKGSVAVNGISFTVAELVPGAGFSVSVIPETLSSTNAGTWRPGVRVNLEFDIIGKYVRRNMGLTSPGLREKIEQN